MTSPYKHSCLFIIEREGKPAWADWAPPSALNCACEQVDAQLVNGALLRMVVDTQVRVKDYILTLYFN